MVKSVCNITEFAKSMLHNYIKVVRLKPDQPNQWLRAWAQGTKLLKATDDSELFDATLYKSAVGMLLYLSGWTRPDIAFAVSNVARFCSRPTKEHWVAVKCILKYLKGTANYGLLYTKKDDANRVIVGFSDADWAGNANDRKSTSGYLFMVSGAPVSWKLRNKPVLHSPQLKLNT